MTVLKIHKKTMTIVLADDTSFDAYDLETFFERGGHLETCGYKVYVSGPCTVDLLAKIRKPYASR